MGKGPVEDRKLTNFRREVSKKFRLDRAILFGSRARGDALKRSDYDIILVSRDFEGRQFTERASEVLKCITKYFPMDLLCYTPEEFKEKSRQIGIVRKAVREGIEFS